MPLKTENTKRYRCLISKGASPFVLKLQSCLGSVWGLIALGFGLVLLSALIAVVLYAFSAARQVADGVLGVVFLRKIFFPLLIGVESLTLLLVTPSIAAVAFADIWEKEVINPAQEFRKSTYWLVAKGFTSAVTRTLLIPLTAIPLEIVALLPYGVSATDVTTLLSEQVIFLATAITLSAAGLVFCSVCSWSRWAVRTYVTVFTFTTGPLLIAFPLEILLGSILASLGRHEMPILIWLASPILLNPVVSALLATEPSLNVWQTVQADTNHQALIPPIWLVYTAVCLVATVILLVVTVHRLSRHVTEHQGAG